MAERPEISAEKIAAGVAFLVQNQLDLARRLADNDEGRIRLDRPAFGLLSCEIIKALRLSGLTSGEDELTYLFVDIRASRSLDAGIAGHLRSPGLSPRSARP